MKKPRRPRPSSNPIQPRPDVPPQGPGGREIVAARAQSWSGPLPPPAILQDFDHVVENGAERIVKRFEMEAEHRQFMERGMLEITDDNAEAERSAKGKAQWMAFIFAMTSLMVAVFFGYREAYGTAVVFGGGSIALVVAAFLGQPFLNKYLGNDE